MHRVDGSTLGCVSCEREKRWLCRLLGLCLNFCGDKYPFGYGAELSIRGVFPVAQWFTAHAILYYFSPLVDTLYFFPNDLCALMRCCGLPWPIMSCLPRKHVGAEKGTDQQAAQPMHRCPPCAVYGLTKELQYHCQQGEGIADKLRGGGGGGCWR